MHGAISGYPGVVSVFPNRGRKLHTTRSWQFMGLERGGDVPHWSAWEKARYGEDTISATSTQVHLISRIAAIACGVSVI